MLTFLQLSDIHFRGANREQTDEQDHALDYEFRKHLIEDARTAADAVGGVSGLLICGDIASTGRGSEFTQATEWLQSLCVAIGVDPWLVWVVPGNHDIDRKRIGSEQQSFHVAIRGNEGSDIDQILLSSLSDSANRTVLFQPLENYQEFASGYSCMFGDDLFWSDRLDLDSVQLHLRGINSSLICGPDDDQHDNRMFIGSDQADFIQSTDVVHYTMCHHPHEWLLDSDGVDETFKDYVHVRVTGHVHVRELIETSLGVHLRAGAVSPDRNEADEFVDPCVPRYDLISLHALQIDGVPHLDISVQGRVWSAGGGWAADDGPNASIDRRYNLAERGSGIDLDAGLSGEASEIKRPELEMRFRLARLQPYDREQCALAVGAPIDDVAQAPAHLQVDLLYRWAEANEELPALWDAVVVASGLPTSSENPFN